LPYRHEPDGAVSVLLITSRETRRWVLPKGNTMKGLSSRDAAAREAFEEAGVSGVASKKAIGRYRYDKRLKNGALRTMTVAVFPLAVTGQAESWPEQDERETCWFSAPEAATMVEEEDLQALLRAFNPAR
jgi:8-oxo-dGTP pyrophosphatase MutT (NUDIX family)